MEKEKDKIMENEKAFERKIFEDENNKGKEDETRDYENFLQTLGKADAVIVLGSDIEKRGGTIFPNLDGKMRTLAGLEIFEKGKADNIITSSGPCGEEASLAEVMKDYLVRMGNKKAGEKNIIDKDKIITENISRDTSENLRESLKILKEKDWHKVIIVTNEFHVKRALLLFKNILEKEDFQVEYQGVACEDVLLERSGHYKELVSHYKKPSSVWKSPRMAFRQGYREFLHRVLIRLDKDDKIATFIVHQTRK